MAAHAEIAKHTSTHKQDRGEFTDPSRVYRQYETAIEMGAAEERRNTPEGERPDGVFTRAVEARREWGHVLDNNGEPSARWLARDAEIEKDIKRHTRPLGTKAAKVIQAFQDARKAYLAELKDWQASHNEIKAREPEKPAKKVKPPKPLKIESVQVEGQPNIRTARFGSQKEVIAQAKAIRGKHPDWKIDVRQGEKGDWVMTVERTRPPSSPRAEACGHDRGQEGSEDRGDARRLARRDQGEQQGPPEAAGGAEGATRCSAAACRSTRRRCASRASASSGCATRRRRAKPPREQIFQEYRDAVDAAVTAHHAEPGAITPVRWLAPRLRTSACGAAHARQELTTNLNVINPRSGACA
jgi:hypothetical protein